MKRRLAEWILSDQAYEWIVGKPRDFYMHMYDVYTNLMGWADGVIRGSGGD